SVFFEKDPAEVLLAVENPSTNNVSATVQLELLDPTNKILANTTQVQSIAPGSQKLSLSLPFGFPGSDEKKRSQILWYRLHYRLSPQASPAETLADGIISLSQIAADVFELRLSATEMVREGNRYRVRIQAAHPVTQRRAGNVRLDAQVKLYTDGEKSITLTGSKVTDNKGQALFDFELPSRFPPFPHNLLPEGGELQVTGRKGAILAQTKGDILVNQLPQILISTDKPLYQPGQVMHLR